MNVSKSAIFTWCFLAFAIFHNNTYAYASTFSGRGKTSVSEDIFNSRMEANAFIMEAEFNKPVQKYVKKMISKDRYGTELLLGRKTIYFPIIEKYIEEFNLPQELKNIPIIESALQPTIESPVGAKGLWQFMPATARMYGLEINNYVDERCDPIRSTIAGLTYLKDLYAQYENWELTIAAYNCGPGRVNKAIRKGRSTSFSQIKKHLPKETRNYVSKFIAMSYVMDNYFFHDLRPIYPEYTLQFCKTITIYKKKTLQQIATETGMDLKTIQKLNPSYHKGIVPTSVDGNFIIIPIFGEEVLKS